MKKILIGIAGFVVVQFCYAQNIAPGNYAWPVKTTKTSWGNSGTIISGSANALKFLEVDGVNLSAGKKVSYNDSFERVLFIRYGQVEVTLQGSTTSVGKGSVVVIMPGDQVSLVNKTKEAIALHEMKYASKVNADNSRGQSSGGSFIIDWDKTEFKPHERGGVRSFFNRPTAMSNRFEMHVTSLNGNTSSHDPHTHAAEEIILLLEGEADMQIGDKHYQAKAGDLFFVPTQLLHGIKNISASQCSYYAYQWE